jgi:protein-tyrosine phosphatase
MMIDLHCHILPGLDDGAKTLDQALEMGRIAWQDGVRKIVATPHLFRESLSEADFATISRKRDELGRAFRDNGIPVELFGGAEVHISHNLVDRIRRQRPHLVVNRSSYLFLEFPSDHVYYGVKNLFFALMGEGLNPIIAHPERNSVFMQDPSLLYELIRMGALAQSNSGSINGLYGRSVEESVFHFLDKRLIHFIASDAHGTRSIPPRLSEAAERVSQVCGEKVARALVHDNPQAVLDDQELPYLPEPENPEKEKKSLRIKIPKIFRRS